MTPEQAFLPKDTDVKIEVLTRQEAEERGVDKALLAKTKDPKVVVAIASDSGGNQLEAFPVPGVSDFFYSFANKGQRLEVLNKARQSRGLEPVATMN